MVGETISHYEITEKLGEGGMGVVYKARDSHLKRFVALKVLPPEKVSDPERKQRFVQEARSASALNHPNIVTVHDIDQAEGVDFIAMEYVEGKTLDELIGRKGLKLNEALKYAIQIADALAKAHAAGIIHRDLKPGNVMVTAEGRVKVLDFGLAKLTEPVSVDGEDSTLTEKPSTETGLIVGTVSYMSPEQAEGKKVDARSDIFSFGSVLYEMLTGRRPFRRDTPALTLAAILHLEPPPLPAGLPHDVEKVVTRCLRKDPERRIQTMADLKVALEELKEDSDSGKLGAAPAVVRRRRRRLLWASGSATLAVLAAFAFYRWLVARSIEPVPASRPQWTQITNFPDAATSPGLSGDGRMVAFIRGPSTFFGPGQVWIKLLAGGEPVQLTSDASEKMGPVFSPDGSRVAYTSISPVGGWDTWIVSVLGGEPRLMLPNASGLVWVGEHRVMFSEITSGLHFSLVTATENRAQERNIYVPPDELGMAHRSYVSPDGNWVLLAEMDNTSWLPCRLVPFDGSSAGRQVGPPQAACTDAAWSPDGQWMYLSSNAGGGVHIWRQRFAGGVAEQITFGPTEQAGIAMAPDGRSFLSSVGTVLRSVWIRDDGGERQVSSEGDAFQPRLAPDGGKLYFLIGADAGRAFAAGELWVADVATGRSERLLPGFQMTAYSVSRDGKLVAFSALDNAARSRIWVASLERRFPPRQMPSLDVSSPVFLPDNSLLYRASEGKFNFLYRMNSDGSNRRKALSDPILHLLDSSRDGEWVIVRTSQPGAEPGQALVAYPLGGGPLRRISQGAASARWSPDGQFFYFSFAGSWGMKALSTFAFALRPGQVLPALPVNGLQSEADLKRLPATRIIQREVIAPGPDPSVYAFVRTSVQRNIYRIPVP